MTTTPELEATRARLRESAIVEMADALVEAAPDIGLTCGEAESIASALALLGHTRKAVAFLVGHGQSESEEIEDDDHYRISSEDARELIATLTSI